LGSITGRNTAPVGRVVRFDSTGGQKDAVGTDNIFAGFLVVDTFVLKGHVHSQSPAHQTGLPVAIIPMPTMVHFNQKRATCLTYIKNRVYHCTTHHILFILI
jgi:hypothetical protein